MKKAYIYTIVIIMAILFIIPVAATIILSLWFENTFSIKGYLDLFLNHFQYYPMFWNSVWYAGLITILQLFVIIPCAFGFMYAKFKGKRILYAFYIMLMMMPLQVTILPNYIGLRDVGLIDTRLGIILPMVFSPFGVIVMYQYMKSIDYSIVEATRLESNSVIKIISVSVIPQLRVCIFAIVLFIFAECWNMLEQPMLFLNDKSRMTLTVFLNDLRVNNEASVSSENLPVIFSAAVIFMIPIFLLYLFFNEYLEKGLKLNDIYKK